MTTATNIANDGGQTRRNTATSARLVATGRKTATTTRPLSVMDRCANTIRSGRGLGSEMLCPMPTSSLEARPVRTFHALDGAPDYLATVLGCFSRCSESFARFAPDGSCGKTSEGLFQAMGEEIFEPCLDTFPTSGMMRNGRCYALRISAIRTDARGCSLWRTPSDITKRGGSQPEAKRRADSGG